jgi:hypothetical protein
MAWYNALGKMAKGVADFTGIPALMHDIATSGSNSDPWYVDGLNVVKDIGMIGTAPVRGVFKGALAVGQKSYELGGIVREKGVETILDTPLMYNKFKNEGESYDDYRTRVAANKDQISLGQATLGILSPGKYAGDASGWLTNGWTDHNARFLSGGFDIFDKKDREVAFSNQYTGKFLSGVQDITASTVVDPLTFTGFLGKGAVIYSKATRLENINGKLARQVFGKFAMTDEKMGKILEKGLQGEGEAAKDIQFLAESDAKTQYEYWNRKKVTNPDAMAYLFGEAKTKEDVVKTFQAVMLKDTQAFSEIASKNSEAALVLDQMQPVSHVDRQVLTGATEGDRIVSPEYLDAVGSHIAKLAKEDTRYRAALDKVSTGGELQYGFERGVIAGKSVNKSLKAAADVFGEPEVITFRKTSMHPMIRMVNHFTREVPSGVFEVNDGNSYKEFNVFLREAVKLSKGSFSGSAAKLADQYLTAATPGDRMNIIIQAESEAMRHVFKDIPNMDEEKLRKIYAIYDSRRASAIQQLKDKGFVSYLDGNEVVHGISPVLQSESANRVVIADIRKLKYAIDAHERELPGILNGIDIQDIERRGAKTLAAADTINDIFKTSVLLRLGYTVRNQAEAQFSMAAKAMALPAAAAMGGKEGLQRFLQNRNTGLQRIVDHVMVNTGRRDSIESLHRELANHVDNMRGLEFTTNSQVKEASKILAELERKQAAGEFLAKNEIDEIRGAIADMMSETVYHGSLNKNFVLDEARPLATTPSKSIASKYATTAKAVTSTGSVLEPGLAFGIEQWIPGRQYKEPLKSVTRRGPEVSFKKGSLPEAPTIERKMRNLYFDTPAKILAAGEGAKKDMLSWVKDGKAVEVRIGNANDGGKFVKMTPAKIKALDPSKMDRVVIRVNQTTNKPNAIRVYGGKMNGLNLTDFPVDARKELFNNKVSNYKQWVARKGWNEPNDPVVAYMRKNNIGQLIVSDNNYGGKTHIALPDFIGDKGRANVVKNKLVSFQDEAGKNIVPEPVKEMTRKERVTALKMARREAKTGRKEIAVNPDYELHSARGALLNGMQDAAENLARDKAAYAAHFDDILNRMDARVNKTESLAVKHRLGYGTQTVTFGGHEYTLPKVFEGASWMMARTSAEQTWNSQVGSQEMAFLTGMGSRVVQPIKPNEPKYFKGWAGILNLHFRNPEKNGEVDGVVKHILDGKDDTYILNWMKNTHEGRLYANDTYSKAYKGLGFHKISSGEADEYLAKQINHTRGSVNLYLPDEETRAMFKQVGETGKPLTGGQVENFLTQRFGNRTDLPEINGLLVTTSKEYKDQERIIDTFNRRIMRFLGSLPEDVFARHPLASATYERQLRRNMAAMAAAKGSDKLTADEINRAVTQARETSRQEVERTLFTIVRRTGASSSTTMKLISPFYTAFENTVQRWSGMIAENPAIAANAARTVAQVVNGGMVVDKDGNRITDASKVGEGQLVVRVPQGFIDKLPKSWQPLVQDSFKNVHIPLASLDVITQGQPGNPGIGPFAVLPAYLILKDKPEAEKALSVFFPAGMPNSAMDIFTPSALRRIKTMLSQDELYVRTYNQMLVYETYAYNTGKRQDEPTPAEISSRTNKYFIIRALASLAMPFAVSPEVDFYAQQYRKFQQMYADYKDPITGKRVPGMADAKFLEMYPDYAAATISLSQNVGGLEPSLQTVSNLRKYSHLMQVAQAAGDPELMGFLANDGDGQYTFSNAAYKWQYSHGSFPGAASTYRQNRNPQDIVREAQVKQGWQDYQNFMGQIETYKTQNGIVSDKDPQMNLINTAKKLWIRQQQEANLAWYSDYASTDRAKYERRVGILQKAFSDKQWMAQNGDRPVVKSALMYFEVRQQVANALIEREKTGGSRSLSAQSNADVAYAFDKLRKQLMDGSPEFEYFINRYFSNDTVVL